MEFPATLTQKGIPVATDVSQSMRAFRTALAARANKPVDIALIGNSIGEGYYCTNDQTRWVNLLRQRMQFMYNPKGIQGGEGFIPTVHTVGGTAATSGAPAGSVNLPQRWTFSGVTIGPITGGDIGLGFGRRAAYVTTVTAYAQISITCDQFWLAYTRGVSAGWAGIAIDATITTVAAVGALVGTGTGTFTLTDGQRFPSGSFTVTIEDEDMTVSVANGVTFTDGVTNSTTTVTSATAAFVAGDVGKTISGSGIPAGAYIASVTNGTTIVMSAAATSGASGVSITIGRPIATISARGINGTTAVAHIVGRNVIYAPAGVSRVNTVGSTTSGRIWWSGVLTPSNHTVTVFAINRAGGGATYNVIVDGITAFLNDGGPSPATMNDGVTNGTTTFTSATANFQASDKGIPISGTNIPAGTTISTVTNTTTVLLSAAATGSGSSLNFTIWGGRGCGIRVWEGCHAGYKASDFAGPAGATAGFWADGLDSIDPDLFLCVFGTNELGQGYAPTSYAADLTSMVALIRAKSPNSPSIVLITPWVSGGYTQAQIQPYIDQMYLVAGTLGLGILDLNRIMPPAGTVATDQYADSAHPTDAGSWEMAFEALRYLSDAENPNVPFVSPVSNAVALRQYRRAIATRTTKPVDVLFLGDSVTEGYYCTTDSTRYVDVVRRRLQAVYNPYTIPGGEGFVAALHTVGGTTATVAPPGGFTNLPQRWTYGVVTLPIADIGCGLGRRSANLSAQGQSAKLTFTGDRCWVVYTAGTGVGYLMYGIDASLTTVATQGVLSGTGTGTFTITSATGFPTASSTITVDDEDMTVTISGTTVTIVTRGVNSTTATTHIATAPVLYAPAGIVRVNTLQPSTRCGRIADSGALTAGTHTVTVLPNPRGGGGTPHNIILDGAMIFYGDGGSGPGVGAGVRIWEAGHAAYKTSDFSGVLGTAPAGLWADCLDNVDPDLIIIQFGPNESGNGIAPTVFQANLIQLVQNIRARAPSNPSIVFSIGWIPGFVTPQQWQGYRDAQINAATFLGCGILDLTSKMTQAPTTGADDLYSDSVHNTDAGALQTAGEILLDVAVVDESDAGRFNQPVYMQNITSPPSVGVAGGGLLYEDAGVLKHIDPAGIITFLTGGSTMLKLWQDYR